MTSGERLAMSPRHAAARPETLWCSNQRQGSSNRWSFPPAVEKLLMKLTEGKSVLQLFGGYSRFGLKLDIDATTKPHVIGDAWLPPFRKDAFDVVIVDPPYHGINQQMKSALLRGAAYVAAERVYWFHTQWVAPDSTLTRQRSWLIRVGDSCACRCLIEWQVKTDREKALPILRFTRGPALRYNRWLAGAQRLPFVAGGGSDGHCGRRLHIRRAWGRAAGGAGATPCGPVSCFSGR